MRNMMAVVILAALTALPGCGQKGPLVLPDAQKHQPKPAPPTDSPPPASAATAPSPTAPTPPTP
jgi:predicted small lipoprotein YifL